jgi:DNA-binding response OmpR family regulator
MLSEDAENRTKALILSMHDDEDYILQAVESGASGYLLKDTSKEEFIKAIHTVIFASVGAAIGIFVWDGIRQRPGRRGADAHGVGLPEV